MPKANGTKTAVLEKEVQIMKEQNEKDHKMILDEIQEIKDMFSDLDKKYANKIVERIVYGMVGSIILAFLYLVIEHVLPKG